MGKKSTISILKAKRILARARSGFAEYIHYDGIFYDHWITEYFDEPVLTRNKMSEITWIKLTIINGIVNALLDKDIITETTGYSRNQIFAFEKYINLFLK